MQKETIENAAEHGIDEEFVDTLIAISVIAKRLARKIKENQKTNMEESRCQETTD